MSSFGDADLGAAFETVACCGKVFSTGANYKRHLFMQRGSHKRGDAFLGKFPCPLCTTRCKSTVGLRQHTYLMHERNPREARPDRCEEDRADEDRGDRRDFLSAAAMLLSSEPVLISILQPRRVTVDAPRAQDRVFDGLICIVEGVALDASVFSHSYLNAHHGEEMVEIRQQVVSVEPDWQCTSQEKHDTLQHYLQYQERFVGRMDTVDFCTNVDIVGEAWEAQNVALAKLPSWLRPNEPSADLLAHCHELLGMNRAQLYLKVAGCRTPAHQENNDFCAVICQPGARRLHVVGGGYA